MHPICQMWGPDPHLPTIQAGELQGGDGAVRLGIGQWDAARGRFG
jgi:hypothetical protein